MCGTGCTRLHTPKSRSLGFSLDAAPPAPPGTGLIQPLRAAEILPETTRRTHGPPLSGLNTVSLHIGEGNSSHFISLFQR